jgi:hypothetical protein
LEDTVETVGRAARLEAVAAMADMAVTALAVVVGLEAEVLMVVLREEEAQRVGSRVAAGATAERVAHLVDTGTAEVMAV